MNDKDLTVLSRALSKLIDAKAANFYEGSIYGYLSDKRHKKVLTEEEFAAMKQVLQCENQGCVDDTHDFRVDPIGHEEYDGFID